MGPSRTTTPGFSLGLGLQPRDGILPRSGVGTMATGPSPSSNQDSKAAWEIVVAFAGAAAGLAAFVYFVGAITVWVRLKIVGYPADEALGLMPKDRVAAVGVRGMFWIGLVSLPALIAARAYFAKPVRHWSWPYRVMVIVLTLVGLLVASRFGWQVPAVLGALALTAWTASLIRDAFSRTPPSTQIRWLLVPLAALFSAALVSWRWLGLVFALLASLLIVAFLMRRRLKELKPVARVAVVVGLILIAAEGALAWQVHAPIAVDEVVLVPPQRLALATVDVPYFGATDKFVYVGRIAPALNPTDCGGQPYAVSRTIVEIPRSEIKKLKFGGPQFVIFSDVPSPLEAAKSWIRRLVYRAQHGKWQASTDTHSCKPILAPPPRVRRQRTLSP
jgi:hypothetical protein